MDPEWVGWLLFAATAILAFVLLGLWVSTLPP